MQTFTLVESLRESRKINNVNDLLSNYDAVVELAKEDVKKIATAKKIFFADFDATFSTATKMLKNTLNKKHLKAIKKFLICENIDDAVQFIVARLLNNMKNVTTNQNYSEYAAPPRFTVLNENIGEYWEDALSILLLEEEEKEFEQKRKNEIKKWQQDWLSMLKNGEIGGETTESGGTQMILIF